MEAKYLFAGIVAIIFLFSSFTNYGSAYSADEERGKAETIVIEGVGVERNVSSAANLALIVSGANNKVTVQNGTKIAQISIGGTGNVVFIPFGQKPKIIVSGYRNGVFRYG